MIVPNARAKRGKKPRPRVPVPPRTNLAQPLTSFIGRTAALAEIGQRFARGVRLVSIVGSPGMGKTRLATRYAELHASEYLDGGGVWFVGLTEALSVADVVAAIAKAAHLAMPDLGAALSRCGPILLVLDNFEQLGADAATNVELWCRQAPQAHVIVTSRERLHVAGESVFELDAAGMDEADAVRLFEERARAAGATSSTRSAGCAVAELVRELDGVPLAIELAAARSRLFSPTELLERLKHRFDLLSVGPRGSAPRHATLKAAIDWSWNLLSTFEQRVLAECSIFAGGFTLDAASRIVLVPDAPDAPDVIEILGALRDKSLVWTHASALGPGTRFALLASIRDYAAEKLAGIASSAEADARARHAAHYVRIGTEWTQALGLMSDPEARVHLVAEQENLSAALRHALSSPGPIARDAALLAINVSLCLAPVMGMRGFTDPLLAILDRAVTLCDTAGVPEVLRARTLLARSHAYALRGRLTNGIADLEKTVEIATPLGEHAVVGEALVMLSARYRVTGRLTDAWDASERAFAHLDDARHERLRGLNLAVRGLLLGELGREEEARDQNLQAMAIFRRLGDRRFEGFSLANMAQLDQASGRFDVARWHYNEALSAFRDSGERTDEARYLGWLAALEWEAGELGTARATYAASIEMLEEVGMVHIEALHRASLAALSAHCGHMDDALGQLDAAMSGLKDGSVPAFSAALEVHRGHLDLALARRALQGDDAKDAARLRAIAVRRLETQTLLGVSEDVRFAVRMLKRELARHPLHPVATGSAKDAALHMGREAQWFRLADGPNVDLARRGAVRKILLALIEQRLENPGKTLDRDALLARGWPRERILADAGGKRVRVAISTLRTLGLGAVLLTRDDGYLLDPKIPITEDEV